MLMLSAPSGPVLLGGEWAVFLGLLNFKNLNV